MIVIEDDFNNILQFIQFNEKLLMLDNNERQAHDYVDWDLLCDYNDNNCLVSIVAKDGGEIRALAIFAITKNPLRRNENIASNIFLHIDKTERGKFSFDFLTKCGNILKTKAVDFIMFSVLSENLKRFLKMNNFEETTINFVKKL